MIGWLLARWIYPTLAIFGMVAGVVAYTQTMRVWTLTQERQELRLKVQEIEAARELVQQLQKENKALFAVGMSLQEELRRAENYNMPLDDDFRGTLERLRKSESDTGFRF